jgi:hypothetical protein
MCNSFVNFSASHFGWGKVLVWDRSFAELRKMPSGPTELVGFFFLSDPYPS